MQLTKLSFILLLTISVGCFSQDKHQSGITDVTKATFLNPGISYEKRIGKFQSILGQAFANVSFSFSYSSSLGTNSDISFDPALTLQYRYYYNYNQRQAKGKRTETNSLNYLSWLAETSFSKNAISSSYYTEYDRRPVNLTGLVWGLQRNYPKRFSLDLNMGFGYLFTTATLQGNSGETSKKDVGKIVTVAQLNLGFWLNKRK